MEYLIVKERKKCSTSDKIQTTDSVNQLTFNQCLKLMNYNFFDSCFRRKENHFFEYKGLLVLSSLHLNILNRFQFFSIFKEGEIRVIILVLVVTSGKSFSKKSTWN